jgi:hypothetical protein
MKKRAGLQAGPFDLAGARGKKGAFVTAPIVVNHSAVWEDLTWLSGVELPNGAVTSIEVKWVFG